ncbi:hypothetical protein GYMLUDRAFT_163887 [Collybiopsis luxurians FD-317 M1]|uniref:Major facilitator superfamily (MFS) profile domain-containing protein n=1 Tax=Collybiopsis luxurians FD-317 M1 TaxID=944289 RepID=A0A0D0CJT6_9AGAR|nr:hypothetical protein GYMLUDRAFT_163887 [Collybiopsis luxurians FD-317 M1]
MEPRPQLPAWTVVDFIHRGHWWTNHGILLLNICLILPLLTSLVNGLDSSLVNGLQILPDWQEYFNFPKGQLLAGFINCAQNIGGLIGLPITPYASDNMGRRLTLILGSVIMLGGVALQFSATTIKMFIAARVLIGFGLSFSLNAAPLLLIELCYPTQRGKISSLFNTTWYVGSLMAAWVCFASFHQKDSSMWTWRIPTLVQAFVPVLQVCLVWFIPESPRFLVSKGYDGQAARVLTKYHANGGTENDPLVVFELAQIRHAIRMEQEFNKSTSYLSLFATPGNRKRMKIIIAIALFSHGNGLVSYYINLVLEGVGITSTETKAAINGGLQVFNLMVGFSSAMLIDRVGRRPLFIISNTGMLIAFGLWTVTEALFNALHKASAAKGMAFAPTIPLIFLYYLFYDIAYTPMLVAYTLEILPYRIRAKGFAVMNFAVYVTTIFNQFTNPVAIEAVGWYYYLVYCGFLIIELVFVVSFIVETKGRTLEETAVLFDGEQPQQDLAFTGGEAATMNMTTGREIMLSQRSIQVRVTQEIHTSRQGKAESASTDSVVDPDMYELYSLKASPSRDS